MTSTSDNWSACWSCSLACVSFTAPLSLLSHPCSTLRKAGCGADGSVYSHGALALPCDCLGTSRPTSSFVWYVGNSALRPAYCRVHPPAPLDPHPCRLCDSFCQHKRRDPQTGHEPPSLFMRSSRSHPVSPTIPGSQLRVNICSAYIGLCARPSACSHCTLSTAQPRWGRCSTGCSRSLHCNRTRLHALPPTMGPQHRQAGRQEHAASH